MNQADKSKIAEICQRHGIRRLALYGSILRDDFSATSDVDVLVEFHEESVPGLLCFHRIKRELSEAFGGRDVDLTTFRALPDGIRDSIIKNAEVQYEEAG